MQCNVIVDAIQIESNLPGEDRFCVRDYGSVKGFAVIDGHGGYLAADIVAINLLDIVIQGIFELPMKTDDAISHLIDESFLKLDNYISSEARRLQNSNSNRFRQLRTKNAPKVAGRAGCCAIALFIVNSTVFIAHVGYVFTIYNTLLVLILGLLIYLILINRDCRAIVLKNIEDDETNNAIETPAHYDFNLAIDKKFLANAGITEKTGISEEYITLTDTVILNDKKSLKPIKIEDKLKCGDKYFRYTIKYRHQSTQMVDHY